MAKEERVFMPKTNQAGIQTQKTTKNGTEDKDDKKVILKKCQELIKERELMWERLGMQKKSCLPK